MQSRPSQRFAAAWVRKGKIIMSLTLIRKPTPFRNENRANIKRSTKTCYHENPKTWMNGKRRRQKGRRRASNQFKSATDQQLFKLQSHDVKLIFINSGTWIYELTGEVFLLRKSSARIASFLLLCWLRCESFSLSNFEPEKAQRLAESSPNQFTHADVWG